MCEPTTLMMVGMGISAAGSVVNMIGSSNAAQAQQDAANYQAAVSAQNAQLQKQYADYNAQIATNNQKFAEAQAVDEVNRGNEEALMHRRKVNALAGTQTAIMAARGLDVTEGTPAGILEDTELLGQYDINTIKNNAAKSSWARSIDAWNWGAKAKGIEFSGDVTATNLMSEASLYKAQANSIDPFMAGASSLLTGAGTVADKWYNYKRVTT